MLQSGALSGLRTVEKESYISVHPAKIFFRHQSALLCWGVNHCIAAHVTDCNTMLRFLLSHRCAYKLG
jgi:hypothetical protein